ncbi:hypothetical protein GCM10010124_27870 [Pilimelia terevasa]|uniref:Uncharacterized protein n=1 Tax=Pilimelia terevasa TaxID=53372 RepID=A0A8J3FJI3_9ACTN|nr:hypothetical protein GCM10010124_27870 [Pilimelia terevasa]
MLSRQKPVATFLKVCTERASAALAGEATATPVKTSAAAAAADTSVLLMLII